MSDIEASINEYSLIHRNVKPLKASTVVIDNIQLMEKRSYQQNSFTTASGVTSAVVKTVMLQLEEAKGIQYPKKGNNVKDLNYDQATEIAEALNIQSIKQKRDALEKQGKKTKPAIMNIHDGKGGIGKTAVATALAVEGGLDVVNRPRVLLIDGDPQGSLRHLFAPKLKTKSGPRTLIDSVKNKSRDELLSEQYQAKFRQYMYQSHMILDTFMDNLKLMPSSEMEKYLNITLSLAQNEKGNEAYSLYSDVILRPLYDDFDLIIIDANPSVDTTLYSFFYAADHHIIPVTGLQQDVNAFVEYLEVCQVIMRDLQPADATGMKTVRTAVTKYSKTNADAKERAETINGTHGSLGTMMIESKKLYEDASANNVPVQLFKSTSRQATTVRDNLKSIYNSATLIPFQDYNLIDEAAE